MTSRSADVSAPYVSGIVDAERHNPAAASGGSNSSSSPSFAHGALTVGSNLNSCPGADAADAPDAAATKHTHAPKRSATIARFTSVLLWSSLPLSGGTLQGLTRLIRMETSLPVADRPRRPEWMKVRAPSRDSRYYDVQKLLHGQRLHTICEEARCPNIAECWGRGTATFQILGDTCTRACRYCYVNSGRPEHPPDPLEPLRLAHAAAQMELKHVVVTSVDRDDVDDRGAGHYAATIRALKAKLPHASVEVLTPDFLGVEEDALRTVLAARPDVFNHNIETVRRLHRQMRGAKASYDKALWLLRRAKELADYPVLTKSGIIGGLGERNEEVVETMRHLRAHEVDVVTIGQYLQPSSKHAEIDRWVHPDEFRWFREQGEALGFGSVFSGPLVRSSYRADEQRHAAATGRGAVAY